MYFSRARFEINSLDSADLFRILRGDMYSTHQLIWKLFPNNQKANRDFLFRQEFEREQLSSSDTIRGLPVFYIVSKREPSPIDGLLTIETKPYHPKLFSGMRLAFETRVNPVVQEKVERKDPDDWLADRKARGLPEKEPTKLRRYHDVMMNVKRGIAAEGIKDKTLQDQRAKEAVIKWLANIGEKHGFALADQSLVEVSGYRQEILRKGRNSRIRFSSVDLSGSLIVTNPELFRELLFTGIGRSRSFGCGMMMVRRI